MESLGGQESGEETEKKSSSATTAIEQCLFRRDGQLPVQLTANPRTPNVMTLKLTLRESLLCSWRNRKRICHIWQEDALFFHEECFSIHSRFLTVLNTSSLNSALWSKYSGSQHSEQESQAKKFKSQVHEVVLQDENMERNDLHQDH